MTLCPHCHLHKSQPDHRGGLCWRCNLTPEIRDRYPTRRCFPMSLTPAQRADRNAAMARRRDEGATLRAIAAEFGLSYEAARLVVGRCQSGAPEPDERRAAMREARRAGRSLRAIAEEFGVSYECVRLSVAGVAVPCRHCGRADGRRDRRGLCPDCHARPGVRRLYPFPNQGQMEDRREPTMAELDALIAERMECLPNWWDGEAVRENGGRGRDDAGGGGVR